MPGRTFAAKKSRPAAPAASPRATRPAAAASSPASRPGTPRFALPIQSAPQASPLVQEVVGAPGQPLAPKLRETMESQLGHDLQAVRIHTDARAAASARAVGARAYTVGSHIVFGSGHYAPGTPRGDRILLHEAVHTLQQAGASPAAPLPVTNPAGPAETEAAQLAQACANRPAPPAGRRQSPVRVTRTGLALAREVDPNSAPPLGSPAWKLSNAKDYIHQDPEASKVLLSMYDDDVVIMLRNAGPASGMYRIRHPMRTIEHGVEADYGKWIVDAVRETHLFSKSPQIVIDATWDIGDIAFSLFQQGRQYRWARDEASQLEKSIDTADKAAARSGFVQSRLDQAASAHQELLRFKMALQARGLTVKTPLLFEAEYTSSYFQTLRDEVARKPISAQGIAKSHEAGRRTIKDMLTSGKITTQAGATYADYYGQAWDQQRAAWEKKFPERALDREQQHRLETGIAALAEAVNRVDVNSPDADHLVDLIDAVAMLYGGNAQVLLVYRAHAGLERLLGPFGFRVVIGAGVGVLQRERLEYALLNYRALQPDARRAIRQHPMLAQSYGINIFPTMAELQAEDRLVAVRKLPDGSLHTGTLAEFRFAEDRNRINHALAQLNQIRTAGPASLVGRIVDGERGAAIGAMIDTGLMVRAPMNARRAQRAQMESMGSGGHTVGRANLEPIQNRIQAPSRQPMPAPDRAPVRAPTPTVQSSPPPPPTPAPPRAPAHTIRSSPPPPPPRPPTNAPRAGPRPVADNEVIATNVRNPAALRRQDPEAHQRHWNELGGPAATGYANAPHAYRDLEGNIRIRSDSWLFASPSRAPAPLSNGNPPINPPSPPPVPAPAPRLPPPPEPDPAKAAKKPPKPAPAESVAVSMPPQTGPNIGMDKTGSKTGSIGLDKTGAPSSTGQSPAKGGAVIRPPKSNQVAPQAPGPSEPNSVPLERVRFFLNNPPRPGTKDMVVRFTLDDAAHEMAWKMTGGFAATPPQAFHYDGVIYVHPRLKAQLGVAP